MNEWGDKVIQNVTLETITKKYILLLLLITVGAELALYGSRYSYFIADVYNFIMIASIFVAVRLNTFLKVESRPKRTKKQSIYLFLKVFVIFTTATFVMDFFSNEYLQDFHENYEEEVIEYTQDYSYTSSYGDDFGIDGSEGMDALPFIDWLDTDGYSFFTDILAGFEEVSRLAYIILVLAFFKLLYPKRWEEGQTWFFWLVALFISSVMFGLGHTFSTEQTFNVFIGTVVYYTNFGLILGVLLLWTRSLWMLIIIHAMHNTLTSISWLYLEDAHVIFYIIMVITFVTFFFMEKYLFTSTENKPVENEVNDIIHLSERED